MATINPTLVSDGPRGTRVVKWETITEADTAAAETLLGFADKTVTFTGTFGGATFILQGSNDGTNWFTLHYGPITTDTISTTVAAVFLVYENTRYIRPSVSGGSSTDVDVIIAAGHAG